MKHIALSALALVAVATAPALAHAQSASEPTVIVVVQTAPEPTAMPAPEAAPEAAPVPVQTLPPLTMSAGDAMQPVPYAYAYPPSQTFDDAPRTRPHYGFVAAGAAVFGITYTLSAMIGLLGSACGSYCSGYNLLYVPVVGPFLALATPAGQYAQGVLVADGLLQAASLAAFVYGLAHRTEVRPHHRGPSFAVLPAASGATAGATLSITTF